MTLPTLREVLALPQFVGAQVLSGQGALDGRVTWVHVMEILDVRRFLSGGELLLSTGLELARCGEDGQVTYLHALAEAGALGLVLELVHPLQAVPAPLLHAARLIDFPLIVFSQEVRFADLTRAAHDRILHEPTPVATVGTGQLAPILDALTETGRALPFLRAQLGPLLDLPPRPRAALLGTLDALTRTNFNVAEVARQLGVRRQTVYYRLEQLRGMLGDLEGRHVTLSVALALRRMPLPGAELDTLSLEDLLRPAPE
ncbi:PucR family transcriptional regulator [Deinococcus hopiensis]|uniref:Purine catabolism regulatory protein n=1 Tax=Deinococcus hopiensis KR-140 TaxID=695939 RepID=A0A1W1URY9_9DEIO|nr:PucR family transcriptional regulator [Deinococcus hopiensis]SMB83862.1 purine catabolism regulatory protein [Deinococcus hopiensis KR-140]